MTIRAVFLGSPDFAVPSLEALVTDPRFEVPLVVTQPDRPAGRGRRLSSPPVKVAASPAGLPVFQPESLRRVEDVEVLKQAQPDVLVVVAYGEILRKQVLDLAPHGALNVHPSLLPRHRGAAPIPAAILAGDDETGVSIIKLVRRLDAGPILAQERVSLRGSETAGELSADLARVAADMLPDATADWVAGKIDPVEQNEDLATYAGEWSRADARIDWTDPAERIERLIRAANPWPVAWTTLAGDPIRIHAANSASNDDRARPGVCWREGKTILVQTGQGPLVIETIQPAGRKAMDALSWWNGLQTDQIEFDA